MLLLVGLGNRGPKYEKNRHNIGFMAVDEIVHRHGFGTWRGRFQATTSEGHLGGRKILIMKPTTFMNESGRAVGEAARFFKLAPEDVVVLHDELDLAFGKIRIKQGGGHAGHNGLLSIDKCIGNNYRRIRIGIGRPSSKRLISKYVLEKFLTNEREIIDNKINLLAKYFSLIFENDNLFLTRISK